MSFVRQGFLGGAAGAGPSFAKLAITKVAPWGDSITGQGATNLDIISGLGFWGHARVLGGSKWDPVGTVSKMVLATGGATTGELLEDHLVDLEASDADTVFDASGINDAFQSVPLATTLANRATLWEAALAEGKQVIALAVIPVPLASAGNSAGAVSAKILAQNNAVRAMASGYPGVFYVDHTREYHAVPGSGNFIGASAYTADELHPNSLGASILGRGVVQRLRALGFSFGVDPLDMGGTLITANGNFSAGTTSPTNFTLFPPGSAGAVGTHSMSTIDGLRWWRFPLNKGSSTGAWGATTFTANTVSPASKTLDAVCLMRVISGTVDNYALTRNETPSAQATFDMSANTVGQITADDGIIVLRTPKEATGGSVTASSPSVSMRPVTSEAVVEIAMLTVRSYP